MDFANKGEQQGRIEYSRSIDNIYHPAAYLVELTDRGAAAVHRVTLEIQQGSSHSIIIIIISVCGFIRAGVAVRVRKGGERAWSLVRRAGQTDEVRRVD